MRFTPLTVIFFNMPCTSLNIFCMLVEQSHEEAADEVDLIESNELLATDGDEELGDEPLTPAKGFIKSV